MKHILVIEDDAEIAHLLKLELGEAGYTVDWAPSGIAGLMRLREISPDLIILDLGLPDLDGSEVARRIRASRDIPIIILTAADAVDRKVNLLGSGADDYMVKPFHAEELLARIKVQLRHREGGEILYVGNLEVHLGKRQVSFNGKVLHLSPKEFELVCLMAGRSGKVFNREEIAAHLWGKPLETESNVVDVHIAHLRSKLRDVGAYGYLRTVRGVGYALRAPEE